jgi:hypothetical protein
LVDEMKNLIKGKPEFTNLDNCGTIFADDDIATHYRCLRRCTFFTGRTSKDGIVTPVFDTQQSIYTSMLSQLETATAALMQLKQTLLLICFTVATLPNGKNWVTL